ncbi:MAG TPA: phosphatase PAP2 family protein, partial [Flavitalea sp.]|nr:phosphatase PAP2 family protein [Flavitalea sp.]
GIPPFREMAILNIAIYDATIAAWDNKYFYNRVRPSGSFKKNIKTPDNPSYPCEYSVAAGASAAVLGYLYPARADSFNLLAEEACTSRILAGVQYPSDVKEGFELGKKIALKVIERAKLDGSDAKWTGKVPTTPGLWNGANPVGATHSQRKPWIIDSASQFRPGPPPDFAKEMAELKNFKKTEISNSRAFYYATKDAWAEVTHQKIFEYNLQGNAPRAARVYALKYIAFNDAIISCWDAKYFYWGIRPDQYDPTFRPTIITPPFPGYPSGHATTSNSMATVLAYLFPADAEDFYKLARECAESRFEGGIHFRTDNEVGLAMGLKIGGKIVSVAMKDGSQDSTTMAKKE